jgi:hypothetical protein
MQQESSSLKVPTNALGSSETVEWRPTRPDSSRQPTYEGGVSPAAERALEAMRVKPTATEWRPRQPKADHLRESEGGDVASVETKQPKMCAKLPIQRLKWRPPRSETSRRLAFKNGKSTSGETMAEEVREHSLRIRIPSYSPRL